jgi:hypothetical protein
MSDEKTFFAQTVAGSRETEYFSAFQVFGETFVIHKALDDDELFRVSHKETGYSISECDSEDEVTVKNNTFKFLEKQGPEKLQAVIARAKREINEPPA